MAKLNDEERRLRQNARERMRRADPEVREREAEQRRKRYATDPNVRAREAERGRLRRARLMAEETTEGYRSRANAYDREARASNPARRQRDNEHKRKAQQRGDASGPSIATKRTPPWISKEEPKAMIALKRDRPAGCQIDHIVPLKGELISGLHVLANLQCITRDEHRRKTNWQRQNPYTQAEAEALVAQGVAVWTSDVIGENGIIDWTKYQPDEQKDEKDE